MGGPPLTRYSAHAAFTRVSRTPVIPPLLFLAVAGLAYALVSACAWRRRSSPRPCSSCVSGCSPARCSASWGSGPTASCSFRFLQAALGMMLFVDASSLDLRNVSLKAALAGDCS